MPVFGKKLDPAITAYPVLSQTPLIQLPLSIPQLLLISRWDALCGERWSEVIRDRLQEGAVMVWGLDCGQGSGGDV